MKDLFLLRHAEAPSAMNVKDVERPLSEQGYAAAVHLGAYLKSQNIAPDVVLCSDAVRTQQTLEGLQKSIAVKKVDITHEIYRGSIPEYMTLIQEVDSDAQSVLLIGHNPIIHSLAAMLAQDDGGPLYQRLTLHYKPATLSHISCKVDSWQDLKTDRNTLTGLFTPEDVAELI